MLSKTVRNAVSGLASTLITAAPVVGQPGARQIIGVKGQTFAVALEKLERRIAVTEAASPIRSSSWPIVAMGAGLK